MLQLNTHSLGAAVPESGELRRHPRLCRSITAPLAASHLPAVPQSLPRPGAGGGTPAAGWPRPWLSARPNSRVVRGSLQRDASVSGTSSLHCGVRGDG